MITIFYKLIKNMSLKLPKNISFQDLYLEDDQTIWFLIWILKQSSPCDRYLSQMILEFPFQVIQNIDYLGYPREYILKNGQTYGPERRWYENGQLRYEQNWKNGKKDGLERWWRSNGQLEYEWNWKNGEKNGLIRGWYSDGQLRYEENWENGLLHGKERVWYINGQLMSEWNWKNGRPHYCAIL